MPSTDRRLELKAKDIDGSDRLTAGCVLIDLASPGVSQMPVYAKGLRVCLLHCATDCFSMPESKYKMLCPFMRGVVDGRKRSSKNYGFSKGLWQHGIRCKILMLGIVRWLMHAWVHA